MATKHNSLEEFLAAIERDGCDDVCSVLPSWGTVFTKYPRQHGRNKRLNKGWAVGLYSGNHEVRFADCDRVSLQMVVEAVEAAGGKFGDTDEFGK